MIPPNEEVISRITGDVILEDSREDEAEQCSKLARASPSLKLSDISYDCRKRPSESILESTSESERAR